MALAVAAAALWAAPGLAAGDFYRTDTKEYWSFVHKTPAFELYVPADRQSYVQRELFGEDLLEITWGARGPVLAVGSRTGFDGDPARVRDALAARYRYAASDLATVTDEEITTSEGLSARFYVLSGKSAGYSTMLRLVVFRRRTDLVFLALMVREEEYKNDLRSFWLRAVNSFRWQ